MALGQSFCAKDSDACSCGTGRPPSAPGKRGNKSGARCLAKRVECALLAGAFSPCPTLARSKAGASSTHSTRFALFPVLAHSPARAVNSCASRSLPISRHVFRSIAASGPSEGHQARSVAALGPTIFLKLDLGYSLVLRRLELGISPCFRVDGGAVGNHRPPTGAILRLRMVFLANSAALSFSNPSALLCEH